MSSYNIARAVEARDDAENERLWAEYDARREWLENRVQELLPVIATEFEQDDLSLAQMRIIAFNRANAEASRGAWMKRDED